MEGNEQLAVIIPMLKQVGAGITPAQFDGPTPCASFSVSDVLEHMTGLASGFAPAFRGEAPPSADTVDSRGLETLVEVTEEMSDRGQVLKLCGANKTVREVLELTELAALFDLFEDAGSAARSFL